MLRVRDLPPVPPRTHANVEPQRPVLYCPRCTSTYSADPADYFAVFPETMLRCEHCEEHGCRLALQLVKFSPRKVRVIAR